MKKILFVTFILLSFTGLAQKRFAEIGSDSLVKRVIVVESSTLAHQLFGGTWVETFKYDTTKNYAGIGYKYHPDKQNFSAPRPYASWILDENCRWQPPVPYPTDGKMYRWNEENQEWDEIVIEN